MTDRAFGDAAESLLPPGCVCVPVVVGVPGVVDAADEVGEPGGAAAPDDAVVPDDALVPVERAAAFADVVSVPLGAGLSAWALQHGAPIERVKQTTQILAKVCTFNSLEVADVSSYDFGLLNSGLKS
jgi:hypothetical protein